ncbi:MAG: 4Fe-4S binding protein, partial [Nitrososphaerales archaeon]
IIEAIGLNMIIMTVGVIVVLRYCESNFIGPSTISPVASASPLGGDIQDLHKNSSEVADLEHATALANAYVLYFLVMMASMTAIGIVYVTVSGTTGLELGLIVGTGIMTAGTISILRRSARSHSAFDSRRTGSKLIKSYFVRGVIISLVVFNELLMGWAFVLASGTPAIPSGGFSPQNFIAAFTTVVGSDWFIFTMGLEMMLTIYMLRRDFQKSFVPIFLLQTIVMLFAPTAIINPMWRSASIYLGSAAMIGLLVIIFEYMYKERLLNDSVRKYLFALISLYGVMMTGLFIWITQDNSLLFVVAILGEMILYFNAALAQSSFKKNSISSSAATKSWMSDPWWVFGFLLMTLVAEFFMAGLIDVEYYGTGFITGISYAPLTGSVIVIAGALAYNFLKFFATITGSSWFYIMMGTEMGTLVLLKIRYTRELETKIRLALIVVVYAIYTIFIPFFLLSSAQLHGMPFIGWSMGAGTAGAFAPAVIGIIAATYLINGALSFLFGSRQVCSLFCTAALMYQGTFPDSMKEFNRTSKIGRKLLTSRISSIYKVVSSLVIASIIIASAISYLDSVGLLNLSFFGSDVAYFLYLFYFDFLWYVIFISIPFLGTYACVTTGMCHWGMFNQFVSRFGLFKLKVKDPDICAKCTTKDCAKVCPVGLTDLPGKFISSGEYKSHKCIGVGNCVSACPYENEYIFDVRHRFGLTKIGKNAAAVQLPVVKNVSAAKMIEPRFVSDISGSKSKTQP